MLGRKTARWITGIIAACCAAVLSAMSEPAKAVVLYPSIGDPAFAAFNGRLFLAYADSNHVMNFAVSTDGLTYSNVAWQGSASHTPLGLAPFNGLMYVAWTGVSDHIINIASSIDGQTYSNPITLPSTFVTFFHPSLAAAYGQLYLAWMGQDFLIHYAATSDGVNFGPIYTMSDPFGGTVAYPPSLMSEAPSGSSSVLAISFTGSEPQGGAPNILRIITLPVPPVDGGTGGGTFTPTFCRTFPLNAAAVQTGLGYLPGLGLVLMAFTSTLNVSLDVNGGPCGGTTFGPYGTSPFPPAVVGFNGHAYVSWTDTSRSINVVQAF